jgi:hypothetical protein
MIVRRIAARVVTGIALVVAMSVATPEAGATTLAPLTIEQFTDASTYIVEGRVEEVWTELDPEKETVWTRARVAVSVTHKGPDQPTTLIVDSPGGKVGDLDVYVPSAAQFSVDEDVFLFLDASSGRNQPVAMFLGKYSVRRAPGEVERYVRTFEAARHTPFDARFLPHPAPEHRVYLTDLREQVQVRLDAGWDGKPIPGIAAERLRVINTPEARSPGRAIATPGSQP